MKNLLNQAIDDLHNEQYEEAIELLEKILLKYPNHSKVRWTLGLVNVMIGYPHKSLKYWKGISEEEIPTILSRKSRIEQKLELYERLYESYNRAIMLVKENDFKEANTIFQELLSFNKEVPLPIDFYQGYILSMIIISEEEKIMQDLLTFPQYVRNHSSIRSIKMKLENRRSILQQEQKTELNISSYGRIKKVLFGIGFTAAILIGALTIKYFDSRETRGVFSDESITLNQKKALQTSESREDQLESTVKELKAQHEQLQVDLENKEQELKNQSEVKEILDAANVDVNSLANKAGFITYNKGLQAYLNGHYQEAVSYLERSQRIKSNEYFSDDAFFYLIQSQKELNETEKLSELYDQFLQEKGRNFISSPYQDDILLGKAEMLVQSANTKDAIILLEKIQLEFPKEWTSLRSKEMVKEITEEKDANN